MLVSWTKGLDKELARDVKENFLHSSVIRKRLGVLIRNKMEENLKNQLLKGSYDTPNWSQLQADAVGYNRALQEILKLIEEN